MITNRCLMSAALTWEQAEEIAAEMAAQEHGAVIAVEPDGSYTVLSQGERYQGEDAEGVVYLLCSGGPDDEYEVQAEDIQRVLGDVERLRAEESSDAR